MKNGLKKSDFLDGKTFQNYALCNEFMTFSESEQKWKIDTKLLPKCHQKSKEIAYFGGPGSICHVFIVFVRSRKNMNFRCLSSCPKIRKIAPEMVPMMISRPPVFAKGVPPAARGPWGGHARAIAISLRNKGKGIKPKA